MLYMIGGCAPARPSGGSAESVLAATGTTDRPTDNPEWTTTMSTHTDSDILFQVDPAPSMLVLLIAAFTTPTVTVYRDGTVFRQAPGGGDRGLAHPPVVVTGAADADRLAAFVRDLQSWDLPAGPSEFGVPPVTDVPTTRVVVNAPPRAVTITVYGFQPAMDQYVSASARSHRQALRRLTVQAAALAEDERIIAPDAVRVVDVGQARPDAGAPDWAGPPVENLEPHGFRGIGCMIVRVSAGDLYRAALTNPSATWNTPSGPRTIAVSPLLPGQPACT